MYLAILLPSVLALYALYRKKLTISAVITAWIMGIIITYFGGLCPFLALLTTFVLTILSDKVKHGHRDEKRNVYQIFSNVLTCTLCMVLYGIKDSEIFLIMYYAVIGGSLADTLASSIGSLAKGKNINPVTFAPMQKGESGAISSLGLSASFIGGFIIGGIYYLNGGSSENYLVIVIMSGLGSYLDSIMGYTIQAKYKCSKCRKTVEYPEHCSKKTKLIKGLNGFNNDMVNLMSNIMVFLITYLLLVGRY